MSSISRRFFPSERHISTKNSKFEPVCSTSNSQINEPTHLWYNTNTSGTFRIPIQIAPATVSVTFVVLWPSSVIYHRIAEPHRRKTICNVSADEKLYREYGNSREWNLIHTHPDDDATRRWCGMVWHGVGR